MLLFLFNINVNVNVVDAAPITINFFCFSFDNACIPHSTRPAPCAPFFRGSFNQYLLLCVFQNLS